MQINPHSLSKLLILQRDSSLGGLCGTLFAEARYVSQEDRKLGREFHFHFRLAMVVAILWSLGSGILFCKERFKFKHLCP